VVICIKCSQQILNPDRIGDEEERLLRDYLLAAHPRTVQPETLSELLRLFDVQEEPPPAA